MAHAKNQGRVTTIPLLEAEEYLKELQLPRIRERLIKKPLDYIASIASVQYPDVSRSRLREWASEQEPATIVEQLGLDKKQSVQSMQALESIRLLDTNHSSFDESVAAFINAQMVGPNPPTSENAKRSVLQTLAGVYSQPPGDALFLSAIGPSREGGYFAYLRHVEQVWQHEIATRPLNRGATYRRISRLKDRFTHALVQRFAMVFMSIGLPSEYEDVRDLYSAVLGDRF